MFSLSENYQTILHRIESSLTRAGRPPKSARLLAVSKGQPIEKILELARLGHQNFGENYMQEWKGKKDSILSSAPETSLYWHFIGRLQTNKIKDLVGAITCFHSIDRLELAQKIDQISKKRALISQGFIEVNLGEEKSKGGIRPDEIEFFMTQITPLSNLKILGLMAMPPPAEKPEDNRLFFRKLSQIQKELNEKNICPEPLTEISMGMSDDFEIAIEEGATWVRVGRLLFKS